MKLILQAALLGAMMITPTCMNANEHIPELSQVDLYDTYNEPAIIPHLGEQPILIFYTDPNVPTFQDYFIKRLEAENFPQEAFTGIGIINMKDAPSYPNNIIRFMVRQQTKKHGDQLFLTDPNRILAKDWDLGNCDDKMVIIFIDEKGELKYLKKGRLNKKDCDFLIAKMHEVTGY